MALFAGISKSSLYNWLSSVDGLKERLDELKNEPFLKARRTLVNDLDKTDTAKWYMERKKKKEFGANLDMTSKGESFGVIVLPDLTDVDGVEANEDDGQAAEN